MSVFLVWIEQVRRFLLTGAAVENLPVRIRFFPELHHWLPVAQSNGCAASHLASNRHRTEINPPSTVTLAISQRLQRIRRRRRLLLRPHFGTPDTTPSFRRANPKCTFFLLIGSASIGSSVFCRFVTGRTSVAEGVVPSMSGDHATASCQSDGDFIGVGGQAVAEEGSGED